MLLRLDLHLLKEDLSDARLVCSDLNQQPKSSTILFKKII